MSRWFRISRIPHLAPRLALVVGLITVAGPCFAVEPTLIRRISPPVPGSGYWSGVAVDDAAGRLYVLDQLGGRVDYYDLEGNHLGGWGSQGTGPGQLDWPTDLVLRDAEVFITEWNNRRIQVFDRDGHFLRTWGSRGAETGQFESPVDLAIDPSGFVYVIDSELHRVQKFTLDGHFLTTWNATGTGISIAPDGSVVVADQGHLQLGYFDSSGMPLRTVSTQSGDYSVQPAGVHVSANGNAYVAGWQGRSACYDAQGNLISSWPTVFSADRITTDGDGRIYVSGWSGVEGIHVYAFPTAVQPTTWSAIKALID